MSDPKQVHQWEQATAGLIDLAAAMGAYYRKLQAEGFSDEQALALTMNAQTGLMVVAQRGGS